MKIVNYKKKIVSLSLALILAGVILTTIGFGLTGFKYSKITSAAAKDYWFQTIHVNHNNQLWYGIKLNDNLSIINIGIPD